MKKSIKKIAIMSLLMALGIVLKSFLSIGTDGFRISFWDIPLFFAGMIGGPLWGGLVALGTDLIYGLCFSSFPFSFIMMFTTIIWGVMGGIFKNIDVDKKKIILLFIVVLITSIIATTINSIYLIKITDFTTMIAGLPLRLLTLIVKWPITSSIIYVIYKSIGNNVKRNFK